MDKVDNLIQNVFNYFLSLYHQNSGAPTGSSFLLFEPIGTHITPNMFKQKLTDTSYSTAKAVEQFSNLTNTIPAINADTFQRTSNTVEQFYDFLLEGSFPLAQDSYRRHTWQPKAGMYQVIRWVAFPPELQTTILEFFRLYQLPSSW